MQFKRAPEAEKPGGKTIVWHVYGPSGGIPSGALIGTVAYMTHWQRYIFDPWLSALDSSCLREVADFLDAHKADRR